MKPGRKEKLKPRQVTWARARWRGGAPMREICWALRIDRSTLQGYAKRHGFGPHPHAHIGKLLTEPKPTLYRCPVCDGLSRTPVHESHGKVAA